MIQFFVYSLIAGSVLIYQGKPLLLFDSPSSAKVPLKWWVIIASLAVVSSGLGNQSLAYVNFPTMLVFKNSKVLFVMTAGFLVFKKR